MDFTTEVTPPFIGDEFPELRAHTTLGEISLPKSYKGKWFVLFSHPGNFTPVCTTEFVSFEKLQPEFNKLNSFLIGLSVEQVYSHIKWIEWIRHRLNVDITFPIIADGLGAAAKTLGMIHPAQGTKTVRSVFIVDPKGIIRLILTYPDSIGRNVHEILRALQALQASDAHQAATPANWPNNELMEDKLILHPALTIQEANHRIERAKSGVMECYDWWFCTK